MELLLLVLFNKGRNVAKNKKEEKPVDENLPKINNWLQGKVDEHDRVDIHFLYDTCYRVNVRRREESVIKKSWFLKVIKNKIIEQS